MDDIDGAHYNLSVLLSKQGQLDGAAENYIRVIAMQPDYVNAHYNLDNLFKELR
jgi:tetratricopeptide (TPR) repeat protein